MQSPATPTPATRALSPERWVQAFVSGKTELDSLPAEPLPLLRPARHWLGRWRGLTRPERLRIIQLLGMIGETGDGEQLLRVGEAIDDDPNVPADWRESVLTAIDEAFGAIEARTRARRRLARSGG